MVGVQIDNKEWECQFKHFHFCEGADMPFEDYKAAMENFDNVGNRGSD